MSLGIVFLFGVAVGSLLAAGSVLALGYWAGSRPLLPLPPVNDKELVG